MFFKKRDKVAGDSKKPKKCVKQKLEEASEQLEIVCSETTLSLEEFREALKKAKQEAEDARTTSREVSELRSEDRVSEGATN